MNKIDYIHGGPELLDAIRPLWQQLNEHHGSLTRHFHEHYAQFTFSKRKSNLLDNAGRGQLRVDLALDTVEQRYIGYCVSIINKKRVGEIESIFIESNYRGLGIGEILMEQALAWMNEYKATNKKVSVAVGNETVLPFYERFGFYPRIIILEQIPTKKE